MIDFCENLKKLIEERGLNQKILAKELGVTEAAISRYINGERYPRFEKLIQMAKNYDLSLDELVGLNNLKGNEILNCPFCGAEAEVVTTYVSKKRWVYSVDCKKCKATRGTYETKRSAINAWNTRVKE